MIPCIRVVPKFYLANYLENSAENLTKGEFNLQALFTYLSATLSTELSRKDIFSEVALQKILENNGVWRVEINSHG